MSHGQPGELAFSSHSTNAAGAERALAVAAESAREAGHAPVLFLPGNDPKAGELAALGVPTGHCALVQRIHPMSDSMTIEAWERIWAGLARHVASIREQTQRLNASIARMDSDNRELGYSQGELERGIHVLTAEVACPERTRAFRIGEAISASRGLGDVLRLPVRLARIAREKRGRDGPRGS